MVLSSDFEAILAAEALQMDLSQKIAQTRKNKGLTQEQLADLSGVTVRTIQRIESGESVPRAFTLTRIAESLGLSFADLQVTQVETTKIEPSDNELLDDSRHFLYMFCLSCFSYLILPFGHVIYLNYRLRKSGQTNPVVKAQARKLIRVQMYWKVGLWSLMLLTLTYNLIVAAKSDPKYLINYLWPFCFMYLLNACTIFLNLIRLRRLEYGDGFASVNNLNS